MGLCQGRREVLLGWQQALFRVVPGISWQATEFDGPIPLMTLLQAGWPVIASASITLLVLVFWRCRSLTTQAEAPSGLLIGGLAASSRPNREGLQDPGR